MDGRSFDGNVAAALAREAGQMCGAPGAIPDRHMFSALCAICAKDRCRAEERAIVSSDRPKLPPTWLHPPRMAPLGAFVRLNLRLAALAKRLDAQYSRYADDLTFSGDPSAVGGLFKIVPRIIRDEGFRLNPQKTRMMGAASRQIVTGLVVNQHLNIDRRSYDRIKAVIHACGQSVDNRLTDPAFRESLSGQIAWVEQVNPRRGLKLRNKLEQALASGPK